jgi:hypothetical protein
LDQAIQRNACRGGVDQVRCKAMVVESIRLESQAALGFPLGPSVPLVPLVRSATPLVQLPSDTELVLALELKVSSKQQAVGPQLVAPSQQR